VIKQIDWEGAVSLQDWAKQQMRDGKPESPEFRFYLKMFGREKFLALWKEVIDEQAKERPKNGASSN
jgi:hypothetical protein